MTLRYCRPSFISSGSGDALKQDTVGFSNAGPIVTCLLHPSRQSACPVLSELAVQEKKLLKRRGRLNALIRYVIGFGKSNRPSVRSRLRRLTKP